MLGNIWNHFWIWCNLLTYFLFFNVQMLEFRKYWHEYIHSRSTGVRWNNFRTEFRKIVFKKCISNATAHRMSWSCLQSTDVQPICCEFFRRQLHNVNRQQSVLLLLLLCTIGRTQTNYWFIIVCFIWCVQFTLADEIRVTKTTERLHLINLFIFVLRFFNWKLKNK